jgi:hypothetical protein
MAWITIAETDLVTVLSSAELEAYRAAALKVGQADPVAPAIAQVADLVRGYVGGNAANVLGAAGTIPQKLLATALDILAVRIPMRVGKTPAAGRQDAHDKAIKLLEQVAAGKFSIEEPLVETTETASGSTPSFSGRTPSYTRDDQDGI